MWQVLGLTMLLWPLALLFLTTPGVAGRSDSPAVRPDNPTVRVCPPAASLGTASRHFASVDTFHYTEPPKTSGSVTTSSRRYGDLRYGYFDWRQGGTYHAHGFAGFDVGEIPDSAVLLAVRFCHYQYAVNGTQSVHTTVVAVPHFPAQDDSLHWLIEYGMPISGTASSTNGWNRRDLTADATAIVDSCRRTKERVCLGLREEYDWGEGTSFGMGGWSPERVFLELDYTTASDFSDIVAVSLAPTSPFYRAGDPQGIAGFFRNAGNQVAHNIPVRFYRDGVAYDSAVIAGLAPGESSLMTAVLPPVSSSGAVKLGMCSMLANDWCRHNDTADFTAYVFPAAATLGEYFEGGDSIPFPPEGWATFHVQGPSSRWSLQPWIDRRAHTGRYHAFCSGASGLPSDDWLISPGLIPRPGRADTVGFFYASNPIEADSLHVWALGGQDPADTLEELCLMQAQTAWQEKRLSLDSFDGQTVHVGFRKNSHSWGGRGVSADDIWFTSDLLPGVQEQASLQLPTLLITPNPASRLATLSFNLARAGPVQVAAFDATGRRCVVLHSGQLTAGAHVLPIDTRRLANGVYFLRLEVGAATHSTRLVVSR
jgi:hypothetical protein